MSVVRDTSTFFLKGTSSQYSHVLALYQEAITLKAQEKNKKPEELIRLDNWYQNELPKTIRLRGKDMHLTHEELVQMMKWKLARGKFQPRLLQLVTMNTPRLVKLTTQQALKRIINKKELVPALQSLCTLKGVGPGFASAVLAAGAPDLAPFMADECLMAIPEIESIDYTTNEYLKFVDHMKAVADRLNGEDSTDEEKANKWTPHNVEMSIWAYFVLRKANSLLLDDLPDKENLITNGNGVENGVDEDSNPTQDSSTKDSVDSEPLVQDESSNPATLDETSNPPIGFDDVSNPPIVTDENNDPAAALNFTNKTVADEEISNSALASAEDEDTPAAKRLRTEE